MWQELYSLLLKFVDKFNPDIFAKFRYEEAMFSLFNHNYTQLRKDLESWSYNESLPFWEAKRAGLLVEVGQYKEAVRILEKSLFYVRKQLNLHFTVSDYSWVSQEAYIMYLISYINFNANPLLEIDDPKKFRKRWSELVRYKCDPWSERRLFEQILKNEYIPWSNKSTKEAFDIGFSHQHFTSSENGEALRAFSFIRFLEEISFPLNFRHNNINIKLMAGALNRIVDFSPYLAISLVSRYNDVNLVAMVLGRNQIANVDIENVDLIIDYHLNVFYEVLDVLELRKVAESFVSRMPEILSRLCVRCSLDSKMKIYRFICEVYKNGIPTENMGHLLRRITRASDNETKYRLIPEFINLPLELVDTSAFPDPFRFLNIFSYKTEADELKVAEWQVVKLIEESVAGHVSRDKATYRLYKLQELGLLSDEQKEKFHRVVWSCVDESGFPSDVTYDKRHVLKSVSHTALSAKEIFKNHLLRQDFVNDKPGTVSIYGGKIRLVSDLVRLSKTLDNAEGIAWELDELVKIVQKLITWWDGDKQKIKKSELRTDEDNFFSVSAELQSRFKDIIDIIVNIVPVEKLAQEHEELYEKLTFLIKDMERYDVPVLRAKACFINVFYEHPSVLFVEIERSMKEKDEYMIVDAFDALMVFITQYKNHDQLGEFLDKALELLIQPLRWDITPHNKHSVSVLREIIKFFPELNISYALPVILEYLERAINFYQRNRERSELIFLKKDIMLASALYGYFTNTNLELPIILEKWKKIAVDKNQFSDIAISWNN